MKSRGRKRMAEIYAREARAVNSELMLDCDETDCDCTVACMREEHPDFALVHRETIVDGRFETVIDDKTPMDELERHGRRV